MSIAQSGHEAYFARSPKRGINRNEDSQIDLPARIDAKVRVVRWRPTDEADSSCNQHDVSPQRVTILRGRQEWVSQGARDYKGD